MFESSTFTLHLLAFKSSSVIPFPLVLFIFINRLLLFYTFNFWPLFSMLRKNHISMQVIWLFLFYDALGECIYQEKFCSYNHKFKCWLKYWNIEIQILKLATTSKTPSCSYDKVIEDVLSIRSLMIVRLGRNFCNNSVEFNSKIFKNTFLFRTYPVAASAMSHKTWNNDEKKEIVVVFLILSCD